VLNVPYVNVQYCTLLGQQIVVVCIVADIPLPICHVLSSLKDSVHCSCKHTVPHVIRIVTSWPGRCTAPQCRNIITTRKEAVHEGLLCPAHMNKIIPHSPSAQHKGEGNQATSEESCEVPRATLISHASRWLAEHRVRKWFFRHTVLGGVQIIPSCTNDCMTRPKFTTNIKSSVSLCCNKLNTSAFTLSLSLSMQLACDAYDSAQEQQTI
jgi:hypothetical protein